MNSLQNSSKRMVVLVLIAGALAVDAAAQDLDAAQKATLSTALTQLKNAESNIAAAKGSAGTQARPAKGSRLKLTNLRLGQAKSPLANVGKLLAGLPTENAEVKAALARHRTAEKTVKEIETILSGGTTKPSPKKEAAPKPGAQPKTTPSKTTTKRLDYKQEKLLKDARFHLRESEGYSKAAATVVARVDGGTNKPIHAEVKKAMNSLGRAISKHKNAVSAINQLPASHPDVAAIIKEANHAGNTMGAIRSRLQAEDRRLDKITNLSSYPNYQADYDIVGDFSGRYGNFQMTVQQPERMAQVVKEDGQCLQEIRRIAKTYQALAAQRTDAGVKMEKRVLYALDRRKQFATRATEYRKKLPGLFDADVAEAESISEQAVKEKKPLFFGTGSGIEQRLGWAEKKLLVIRAFDENEAKACDARLAAARKRIEGRETSLEAEIIENNPLPPDNYRGGDRRALEQRAIETWAKEQKDADVLAFRIPSQAWKRSTRWQWSGTAWYKVDTSKIQVQLIVKHDGEKAVVRPINIFKDHLQGDSITSFPFDTMKVPLTPRRFVLRSKVK